MLNTEVTCKLCKFLRGRPAVIYSCLQCLAGAASSSAQLRPAQPIPDPVSSENGDPGSPFSYEIRDPGPQIPNILWTLGFPISYDIRDASMKSGTLMEFYF